MDRKGLQVCTYECKKGDSKAFQDIRRKQMSKNK